MQIALFSLQAYLITLGVQRLEENMRWSVKHINLF